MCDFCLWCVNAVAFFHLLELDSTAGVALLYSVTILASACSVVQTAVVPDGEFNVSLPKGMRDLHLF